MLPPILDVARLIAGIAILYLGAEWMIRGSAALARTFGVKPLVIGLTVVAYGTSAPELAVSTKAALDNVQPIAIGTVIGACAANISLILGLTALISPPTIDVRLIKREVPILLGSALAVPLCLRDGYLSRNEGIALVACAILFTVVTLTVSAKELDQPTTARAASAAEGGAASPPSRSRAWAIAMSAIGVGLLVFGSNQFVSGARGVAAELDMSERMLGLTVVAIGTSLPELIASIMAASRGHSALAIGSVIGSNLLNVFLVLGIVAYLRPISFGERMHAVDGMGLVGITLLAIITLRGERRVSRLEGGLLVLAYVAFVIAAAAF
ncbi:MAG: calcium/sodium antiporter [Kofleriaceae bacterium]